jgi:hypothetical protein
LSGYWLIVFVPNTSSLSFDNANREKSGKYAKTCIFKGYMLSAAGRGGKFWHNQCAIGTNWLARWHTTQTFFGPGFRRFGLPIGFNLSGTTSIPIVANSSSN